MNHCVLDELEVETQHFSKLISDARRKFKDFLIAVDKISPFFIEMYVRNSMKPSHKRKDTLSSSTPYRKLRQDYSSSEENIPQRLRHKSLYRCSVYTSEQDFKNNNICNDYENCRKGKLHQNGKTENVSYLLDYKVHRGGQNDEKRPRNSTHGSPEIVIIASQRKSESERVRSYRFSTESLPIPRYQDVSETETNQTGSTFITGFAKVPRRTGSKVRIPSYVENRYHNTSVDIEEGEGSPDVGGRSPVLVEIVNKEEMRHGSKGKDLKPGRDAEFSKYILDCSLSEDSRHGRTSPLVPHRDVSPRRLKCKENCDVNKEKGTEDQKEAGKTSKYQENKFNSVDQQKARNRSSMHLSDTSNVSYSKDQRKKLKKKMKNALKKPENCCFMGQV